MDSSVKPLTGELTTEALAVARIVVLANALSERTARGSWSLPNPPAFTNDEVRLLERWVSGAEVFC